MKLTKEQRRLFYLIFFPTLAERIIVHLFHMVDTMMLGQTENSSLAVAAVGMCGSPINLAASVLSNFFIGFTATIAWNYGAKRLDRVRNVAHIAAYSSILLAILFSILPYFFAEPIMSFVCGESDALPLAISYFRINAFGLFFQIITLSVTASFRGIGITKLPLLYNIIGGAVNVFFNYLLIFGHWGFPAMGVDGAAWATVLSKFVSMVIAIGIFLLKKSDIQFSFRFKPHWESATIKRILSIGLTAAGEQVVLQGGNTIATKFVANLPVSTVAANQVAHSVENFAWCTGPACSTAATTLFGQSLGAKDEKKARAFLRLTIFWALILAALEILLMTLGGQTLARLYSNDTAIYPLICSLFFIAAIALPFINVQSAVSGALRSAGYAIAPLLAGIFGLWVFRVGGGYLFLELLDSGIFPYRWCMTFDHLARFLTVVLFFLSGRWKSKALKEQ